MKNLNSLKILLCCLGWCAAIHADVVLDSHHDDDHYHYVTSPSLAIGQPAVATLHATAVNNIFAQTPAFNTAGNVPIEVRYLPEITVFVPPAVAANVNTEAEFDIVTATAVDDSPVISLWYVDLLSTCGSTENSPGIAGCAGGSVNVVESSIAMSGSLGPELLAHEFGHNLGLDHTPRWRRRAT